MDQETGLALSTLLISIARGAAPLLFAAMGGLLSERSGVIQIALEGMMLMGALFAAITSYFTGSPWLGFAAGSLAGLIMAGLKSFFVLKLRTDQIVTGTAINILAVGIAPFITKILFQSTGSTPNLPIEARFVYAPLVISFLLSGGLMYWFSQTRSSLWVQFAGEAPQALQASGISVGKVRLFSLLTCGLFAGMGGATLSLCLASAYSPNMTAGRGFMALAALIFGRWRPLPTFFACLLFALTDAIQIRLQGATTGIPVQFIQILPYLITIIALAGFFGRSQAPKGLGQHI
ncbi:MAG: ABC transporter permease [Oligoflexia bacterium]|nr:MAG: ABC transporter permease [Oligoflexia bacterium]